jgi:hypothetical protein
VRGTPLLAIVFTTLIAFLLIVTGDPTWIPIGGFVISFAVMTTKDLDIFARAGVLLVVGAALFGPNVLLTGPRGPFQTEELEALKG